MKKEDARIQRLRGSIAFGKDRIKRLRILADGPRSDTILARDFWNALKPEYERSREVNEKNLHSTARDLEISAEHRSLKSSIYQKGVDDFKGAVDVVEMADKVIEMTNDAIQQQNAEINSIKSGEIRRDSVV